MFKFFNFKLFIVNKEFNDVNNKFCVGENCEIKLEYICNCYLENYILV